MLADSFRFDYTHARQEFVIRMGSFVHETMAELIGGDIIIWSHNIKNGIISSDERTMAIANGICPTGSPKTSLPLDAEHADKKSPDKSFQHDACGYPGLVVEVSWSRRKLDLPWLAKSYILRSKGGIRTVVGINLNDIYRSNQVLPTASIQSPATFSVWRARLGNSSGNTKKLTVETSIQDQVHKFISTCPNIEHAAKIHVSNGGGHRYSEISMEIHPPRPPRLAWSSR